MNTLPATTLDRLVRILLLSLLILNAVTPVAAQSQTEAIRTAAPQADEEVLELHELPWRLRRDLPAIKVSVRHAPNDPELRFAKINGERYTEGDSLEMGPTIVEIRTDGVVVEFVGQQIIIR